MKTVIVSSGETDWLNKATRIIHAGGIVAFPTDTVYGIGTDPFQPEAAARLYKAKGRSAEKPIPILVSASEQLSKVAKRIPAWADALMQAFWPGALTLVLEKQPAIPAIVSRTGTIGVRMPDHPVAIELMRATGPLAVTSANPSGEIEARGAAEVFRTLSGKIEMIVDGGVSSGGRPSTVLDCTIYPPRILRDGPISPEQIKSVLDSV